MKVAVISEWLDTWRGGAETSTRLFIDHLLAASHEVHVFTRSRPAPAPGFSVHSINGAAMSRTRRSVMFMHRVERAVRAGEFDIVHAITPCMGADIYQPRGGTVAESVRRNLALLASGPLRSAKRAANLLNFKQRHALLTERMILRGDRGPIIVALSDYVVRQLKHHYGVPDARIRKIFNGVEPDPATPNERARHRTEIREEFGISADATLVLHVAHNFRLKGTFRWIEALARLKNLGTGNIRSLVIGKGESRAAHRAVAAQGIGNLLQFVGETDRVRHFLHAADVLVHPTYYDPCSRVVLEAMVSGVVPVTTRWDGSSEMIQPGENGFVLEDPTDISALAEAVAAAADPDRRAERTRRASDIADSVSMARHAREMTNLYEEIVNRRTSAAPRPGNRVPDPSGARA